MENNISFTRTFNAPVEMVWKVWTDPELVKRWWGPARFTCPVARIDFREGGTSVVAMKGPKEFGDHNSYSIWQYTQIIPMKRIEFIQNLADEHGNKADPVSLGMPPDFPQDIRTVVIFQENGNGTVDMTITEYADFGQMSHFAKLGLEQTIDKIVEIFA